MELSDTFVGAESCSLELEITPRLAMNYAAAVADANDCYFNDEVDARPAPPLVAVALSWNLGKDFVTHWELPDFPHEALTRLVHYRESLVWHSALSQSESVRLVGVVSAIVPHRAGTLFTIRFTATNSTTGRPAFSEEATALLRGVTCKGEGRVLPGTDIALPEAPGTPPQWEHPIEIDSLAAHVYDGCTGISFPIHTSRRFARSVGLHAPIYHGTATLARACASIVNRECDGDPKRVCGLGAQFTGIVPLETTIRVRCYAGENRDRCRRFRFDVLNEEGKYAVSNGYLDILG